eukprot:scaffold919_cov130-Cylindrotheca_fusiformis.AAC.7
MRFAVAVSLLSLSTTPAAAAVPNNISVETRGSTSSLSSIQETHVSANSRSRNTRDHGTAGARTHRRPRKGTNNQRLVKGRGRGGGTTLLKNEPTTPTSSNNGATKTTTGVDVGVLGHGYKEYSYASIVEDLSLAATSPNAKTKQRTDSVTIPFPSPIVCDPNSQEYNLYTCDCTGFSVQENRGHFACISAKDFCTEDGSLCGPEIVSTTIYDDDAGFRSDHCYKFLDDGDNLFEKEVCYTRYHSINGGNGKEIDTCSIFVNGVPCSQCHRIGRDDYDDDCYAFDCSNTAARIQGNSCQGDDIVSAVSYQQQQQQTKQKLTDPPLDVDTPYRTFPPATVCDKGHWDYLLYNCDCSDFDADRMRGSFSCMTKKDFCVTDGFCGHNKITNTIHPGNDDGGGENIMTHHCYYIQEKYDSMNTVCYSSYYYDDSGHGADSCAIHVDGVRCNTCQIVDGVVNKDGAMEDGCTRFDCTNTQAGNKGMDCLGNHIFDALISKPKEDGDDDSISEIQQLQDIELLKSRVLALSFTIAAEASNNSTVSKKGTAAF